jgi:hypothetical protein
MGKKSKNQSYEKKMMPNGTPNPKYVDVLEVDKPIAGQNYGCFSFISPEKIIKQREMFYFEKFLKSWEISKSMEKFHEFLNFISFKYRLKFEDMVVDFEEFLKEEKDNIVNSVSLENDYKTYLDNHEHELEKEFNVKHNFQTSVRGFKAGGNFQTQEEAEFRAKMLREANPHFDVYVGPIGVWLPWEPEAYKTGRVEYMEDELNQLAHEKINNENAAKNAFEQRIKETKQKAIDDNKKNAEKFGTAITQDVDDDGNLIGVGVVSQEKEFSAGDGEDDKLVSVDEVRAVLFEGENIVTSSQTDHGQSELVSGPFVTK